MHSSKEIATGYLERFIRLCDSTNKFVLIAITVLIGNWLAFVEPHFNEFEQTRSKQKEKIFIQTNLSHLSKKIDTVSNVVTRLNTQREQTNKTVESIELEKQIQAQKDTLRGLKEKKAKGQKEENTVNNEITQSTKKLLDGTPFGLLALFMSRPREGSVVLGLLLLSTIIYLYIVRRKALRLAGRLIRLCDSDTELRLLPADDILVSPPLWLAPAPIKDGTGVCANRLKEALGWGQIAQGRRLQLATVLFLILIWQARLAYITVFVNTLGLENTNTGVSQNGSSLLVTASLLIMTLSAFLMGFWVLSPWPVEDAYNHEQSTSRISRGEFISVLSTVVTTALLGKAASTNYVRLRLNGYTPRPRHSKRNAYLWKEETGLYVNKKSGKQHWIEKERRLVLSASIQNILDYKRFSKNLILVKQPVSINFNALPQSHVAIYCERMALNHLAANQVGAAFIALREGVIRAKPDQVKRLVGLMSRIRAKNQDQATALFDLLEPYSKNEVINSLRQQWNSEYLTNTLPQRMKDRWQWDGRPI